MNPLSDSPFNQTSGESAPAVQAALTTLEGSIPEIDNAAVALRAGTLTQTQRDSLLADMLDLYKLILNLLLGRT